MTGQPPSLSWLSLSDSEQACASREEGSQYAET